MMIDDNDAGRLNSQKATIRCRTQRSLRTNKLPLLNSAHYNDSTP